MRTIRHVLPVLTTGLLAVAPATQAVTVRLETKPTVGRNVGLSFSAAPLPGGGYYYGVLVLAPYRHYTRTVPPACSTSSDMQRTDYGYPQPKGLVTLALTPAKSDTHRWCHGGSYEGAIYAVPHAAPCEGAYPCRAEPYEPSPCWSYEGRPVCGVVAAKLWRFPDALPQPLASGTTILAHFSVRFPARTVRVLKLAATVYNVNDTLDHVITSHESVTHAGRHVGQDFSRCVRAMTGTVDCTGKYALTDGTITFAGTIPSEGRTNRLAITGGTGRYGHAEGTILTEYNARGTRANESITFEA
jgi:hypothetical protein